MKKILYIFLVIISILLIYFNVNNHKYNYTIIGDEIISDSIGNYNYYVKNYLERKNSLISFNNLYYNDSIIGLANDIKNNRTIIKGDNEYYLKKVLRESDFVVIDIGMKILNKNYDQYNMNKNYYYFNRMLDEIEKLIEEVTKYSCGKILFLGYYNPSNYYDAKTDEFFYNIDSKLQEMLSRKSIIYVDLYDLVKGNHYKLSNNSYLLNQYAHKKIASIIEYYLE